jgi:hypothetical protein
VSRWLGDDAHSVRHLSSVAIRLKIGRLAVELEYMLNTPTFSSTRSTRNRAPKSLIAGLACVCAAAAFGPATASASSPGSAPCLGDLSTPFAQWGDFANYRLAPDGDFQTGDDWTLAHGATLVGDSSPLSGGTALELSRNESALSPPICIDGTESFSRTMARAEGTNRLSGVLVEAVSSTGRDLPVGYIQGDDSWSPSSRFLAPRWLAFQGNDTFQYRFTGVGKGTTIIDDVNVDPRARW